MAIRKDCRHYSTRSTPSGDLVQRCRVTANETMPFGCPEGCLFFEPRSLSNAGWERFEQSEDGDRWGEGFPEPEPEPEREPDTDTDNG